MVKPRCPETRSEGEVFSSDGSLGQSCALRRVRGHVLPRLRSLRDGLGDVRGFLNDTVDGGNGVSLW